jgi:hypothetical protein
LAVADERNGHGPIARIGRLEVAKTIGSGLCRRLVVWLSRNVDEHGHREYPPKTVDDRRGGIGCLLVEIGYRA